MLILGLKGLRICMLMIGVKGSRDVTVKKKRLISGLLEIVILIVTSENQKNI